MYILEPVLHQTVWGGTRLNQYIKNKIDKLGHLYLVNGHKELSNRIMNGNDVGKTLHEMFEMKKQEWNLSEFDEFPLTIALVDASDNLSIQVHPDAMTAGRLEGEKIGKTESWLFMESPISGWIYDGCSLDSRESIERAVQEGKMEEITKRLPVQKNDYVCVDAGTLHAMTAGSLVYEIEFGSDYTYRFYDYDRRDDKGNARELHIDKALQAVKPGIFSRVKHNCTEGWIQEENYEICLASNLSYYRNEGIEIECITVLGGNGGDMSILLFPGEELKNIGFDYAVIARIRR